MAEFKYALTRVCLRSGTLTLPGKMLDVFPAQGTVELVDTTSDTSYEVEIRGPRTVAGLGPLFAAHDLEVNDELIVRPLEDGRYAVTPIRRERRPDWDRPDVVQGFLDALVAEERPLTEAEIRALHPYVPAGADLRALLEAEPRLTRVEGRWRPAGPADDAERAASDTPSAAVYPLREDPERPDRAEPKPADPRHADPPRAEPSHADRKRAEALRVDGPRAGASPADPPRDDADRARGRRPSVVGVPSAGPNVGQAGLNSEQTPANLEAVRRARNALEAVGFQVEGLGQGQLMATAELGRRTYRALVHTHPDGERLDWAALLTRRRDTRAKYLAVFGDHRDLARLQAPAELARATLWSWTGVQRMIDLSRTVPISTVDLETHFERAGLFEHGLERFEQGIAKRIEERGAFSAVLTRLAAMRAPAIFLLEDVTVDVDLPRDQLVRILERLGEAPFHLVARVDSGEFCLRYRVSDALLQLAEYAQSLRERLPDRRRDRVVGLAAEGDAAQTAPAVGRRARDSRAPSRSASRPDEDRIPER